MSDLISRQAAIDYLVNNMTWYDEEGYESDEDEKRYSIEGLINGVPSAQQWIPCSERLPEEDIKVLVTDEDGDIYIAYYDYNEWSDDPKIEWWTGEFRIYPIAWMPLPEPWKGEQP